MSVAIQERLAFAPPPTPGLVRSMVLALLAHGALVAMLTLGVQWKREATPVTAEAELWSALPVQAAAPAPEETAPTEPLKPPPPEPKPKPEPKPEPVVAPKPAPQPDPAIALAREKEKAKLLKEQQLQQLQLEKEKLTKEKLAKEKLALKEKELLAKAAKDKAAKREADEAKALEADRQKNLKRMAGLAGAGGSGEAGSTSTALQSSGTSVSYTTRIGNLVKRQITLTDAQKNDIPGNPGLDIDIKAAPDGTLLIPLIVKSSGSKTWDDAVLNAIRKLETLPRDSDGKVPSRVPLTFRPKD